MWKQMAFPARVVVTLRMRHRVWFQEMIRRLRLAYNLLVGFLFQGQGEQKDGERDARKQVNWHWQDIHPFVFPLTRSVYELHQIMDPLSHLAQDNRKLGDGCYQRYRLKFHDTVA